MTRRAFVQSLAASAVVWPFNGLAQTPPKRPVIGFLGPGSKTANEYYSGVLEGMRELGYLESRDYVFHGRYADGDFTRLPLLAEELVRLKPDVIVAGALAAALAAKKVTGDIPIIGINLTDPVGAGLVASEARPGANVTGTIVRLEGLTGKQLEIALDLMPAASTIGVLNNANNPASVVQLRDAERAAERLKLRLLPVDIRTADEIASAFQKLLREDATIVLVPGDAAFLAWRRRIAALSLVSRMPSVYSFREHVEDGGLISYGIDLRVSYRRAAFYVDKILKGEKPADLPVEFPTKLGLVINLATATALGLSIPPTLLARADEVIE
jgi:putative ABC transport system substrate-binding protein